MAAPVRNKGEHSQFPWGQVHPCLELNQDASMRKKSRWVGHLSVGAPASTWGPTLRQQLQDPPSLLPRSSQVPPMSPGGTAPPRLGAQAAALPSLSASQSSEVTYLGAPGTRLTRAFPSLTWEALSECPHDSPSAHVWPCGFSRGPALPAATAGMPGSTHGEKATGLAPA